MSSSECSSCEKYSEDFTDEDGSVDDEHSVHSAEAVVVNQHLSQKHANCSCQSEVKHPIAHHSGHETTVKCPISDKDESNFSTAVAPPQMRARKLSEPVKKNNKTDNVRQRAKSQVQNPRAAKQKAPLKNNAKNIPAPTSSIATQQLLCARKMKIDNLRNQIIDLERQLLLEQKENKILKNLYNRQQKELHKVEESRVEIPELEKAHDEEIRVLKTLMRKGQEKNKELESKLRSKDEELQRRLATIQSLKASLQEKNKIEAEAEKRITALKMRIEKRDRTIMMLQQNLSSCEKKLTDDRKCDEMGKAEMKDFKKKHKESKETSGELKFLKQNACDASDNISQKLPNSPARSESQKHKSQSKKAFGELKFLKQNACDASDNISQKLSNSPTRSESQRHKSQSKKTSGELKFLKHNACDALDDISQKLPNSPARNESQRYKSQDLFSSQAVGDQSSLHVLKESAAHAVECKSENDQNSSTFMKCSSKTGTSTQSLKSSSGSKIFKMQPPEADKTVMKQSPSSEYLGRMNIRIKSTHSEALPLPLIVPSTQQKAVTESDSSFTGSCSEEYSSMYSNHSHKSQKSIPAQSKTKTQRNTSKRR